MTFAALLAGLIATAPAAAADGETSLAVFRRTHYSLELPLVDPFERLLHDGAADLERVENVPVDSNGGEFLFRLPSRLHNAEPSTADSVELNVFESEGGIVAFLPDSGEFAGVFEAMAGDPDSYPDRKAPPFRRVRALLTREPLGGGELLHTLSVLDPSRVRHPQWRASLAFVYRFSHAGRSHAAFFLFRTQGGEGRMAAAIARLAKERGDRLLTLNRGEIFAYGATVTTGTSAGFRFEAMGVDAAVIGAGELTRIDDLRDYLNVRGGEGTAYVSANLVYSTSSATTAFPPFRTFETGGLRVAVIGLTHPGWEKYLPPKFSGRFKLLDPQEAAMRWVPRLRRDADVVVALTNLGPGQNARLRREIPGIDIVAGDSHPFETSTEMPEKTVRDGDRGPFDPALLVTADAPTVLTEVRVTRAGAALEARERHLLLDDSLPDLDGYVKFKPEGYGVFVDSRTPILPSARRLYPEENREGPPRLKGRDFWNLTASLLAERTGAEAAFVPIYEIFERTTGDYSEELVREWFRFRDRIVVFELPGAALKGLVSEVRRQEGGGGVPAGGIRLAAGGIGEGNSIHGVPIDARTVYRVAATDRVLARSNQFPGLKGRAREIADGDFRSAMLEELRGRSESGWPAERYRPLLKGRPIEESGLWTVHFRDVSVRVSNTKVVSDPAFSGVSNARVRGFDELLIGGVSKTDLEYRSKLLKWTNAFEIEYSRSRLRPPGQAEILNTPKNRTSALTVGTWKLGTFPWHAVARSFGPSIGFQYEGHVERLPFQRRKHVASIYPGVEFFNGTVLRSLEVSGNLRRDWTPQTPVNKYGFRSRALLAKSYGAVRLQGEFGANYFIRTPADTNQDLRLELNTVVKVHLPVWKDLTLSPFVDFYYFVLKVRPVSGYSTITGLSLNFSRLWKPQYESF
jgi:5'-nucleotidase/UDP-sugar diphosphatase